MYFLLHYKWRKKNPARNFRPSSIAQKKWSAQGDQVLPFRGYSFKQSLKSGCCHQTVVIGPCPVTMTTYVEHLQG